MYVTGIDITGLHYDNTESQHEGHVILAIRQAQAGTRRHTQFVCHSRRAPDCAASVLANDLVQDALRQAHRMPGFRRGEQVIRLATIKPRFRAKSPMA